MAARMRASPYCLPDVPWPPFPLTDRRPRWLSRIRKRVARWPTNSTNGEATGDGRHQ